MIRWVRFGPFFLSFGKVNPERNGPDGVRVYHAGNRIEKRDGQFVYVEDKQYHHFTCPCFQCAFRKAPRQFVSPEELALDTFKDNL